MVNLLDSSTFSISLMSVLVTNVRLVFFKYPTEALCGGHCHILPGCPFNCCPRLRVTGTDTCSYLPPQGCPGCRDVPSIKVTLLPGSPTSNDGSICEYKNSLPSYPKSGRLQRAILAPEALMGLDEAVSPASQLSSSPYPVLLPSSPSPRCSSQDNASINILSVQLFFRIGFPGNPTCNALGDGQE